MHVLSGGNNEAGDCVLFFLQSAHLAMIDTLMMAYTAEMVSLERVVSCLQKYRPLDSEDDVPYDTEEAVTSWINKVSLMHFPDHGPGLP